MSFQYAKLIGKIKECCGSQTAFAREMGLSERTVSVKINGKVDWRQNEIAKACVILGISRAEIPLYFFNQKVQN